MYIYILSFLSQEGFFILSAAQASFSRRPSPALFLFSSALSYLVADIFPESPPPIPPISSSVLPLVFCPLVSIPSFFSAFSPAPYSLDVPTISISPHPSSVSSSSHLYLL